MRADDGPKCFALAADDRGLMAFPSVEAAIAYCEAIDVEDGQWDFFDLDGVSLRPRILESSKRGKLMVASGRYDLVRDPTGRRLSDELPGIAYVEGCGLQCLDDVAALIRSGQ